jgi:ATP-dependent helicase/nuclease subunit B
VQSVTPRVFTIPPGAPFLATFARALLDGAIVPGFSREAGPLALAKATIYVPTRRAGRALAAELARQSEGRALLLPKIKPLGALEGEAGEKGFDNPLDPELPRAAGDIERRMVLGELILAWARNLKQAVVAIEADGAIRHAPDTLLVAADPADAWRLSADLTALIDEMIVEEIDWKALGALGGEFDDYWRITLNFLEIAIGEWPKIQEERGFVDLARRQQALIARAIEAVAHEKDPVVAIGSTGSNIVTARLLAAIARAPNGAVVLPGLDLHLDEKSFAAIRGDDVICATHPQAFLARLIETIGIKRADVVALAATSEREAFVSEAFRPADTTDLWPQWRAECAAGELERSLSGVSLIEAGDEREEALAIAVCLREALEHKDFTAALVTPDRGLAERVRAELLRWDVEIDDSGGVSLAASPVGTLARLILRALTGAGADWVALLSHPAFSLGFGAEAERLGRLFELGVLRSEAGGASWREHVSPARNASRLDHAHPRQKSISDKDWIKLADFAARLDEAFAPLRELADASAEAGLKPWLAAHRKAIGRVVAGDKDAMPAGDDGEALAQLFDEIDAAANVLFSFRAETYAAFFDALIGERVLRGGTRAHPRVKILGLLEARLIGVDRLIMAGLDETVWPPRGQTDCFLNRSMRAQLGLSSPERRIGQTAHDFAQGFGAPEVVLTRARKHGGAPTTPSRLLQRMEALAGGAVFADLRARGRAWLDLGSRLDAASPTPPLKRPAPRPPLALRPSKLSVTRIETLRRDPYAIYAEFILKLLPLPELDQEPGSREIGVALHAALEEFCRLHPAGPLPEGARNELVALARGRLALFAGDPEFLAFRWPRLLRGLDAFLAFEAARRPLIERIAVEAGGRLPIDLDDGSVFTLTAKADRIELLKDGTAALVDYKSGDIPTLAQVRAGFAPQLTLEAAMLSSGAFAGVGVREIAEAFYVPIGGDRDKPVRIGASKEEPFGDLIAGHYDELAQLLNAFRNPAQGYPARPFPQFALRYNAYDHLARTREWSSSGAEGGGEE